MTAWKRCPFAWVIIGQSSATTQGESWDLSFVERRDGLPNPSVGGDGPWAVEGRPEEKTPRLWSIIVFMQVLDASPT
jgi:hypothetical protein